MNPIEVSTGSDERFQRIYEHAATGIAITDLSGRFTQCNPAYTAIVGYSEEELRALEFMRLVHPDDREANAAIIRRLVAQEIPSFTIENRYVNKAGQPVWVEKFVSLLRDARHTPTHIIALVTDITQRRLIESALRESELTFRATFENAAVGMAHVSPENRFIRVNGTLSRITGYPHEELVTKTFVDITHPDDLHADLEQARRLASGEIATYSMEKRYIRKDGSIVWVNLTGSAVRDPNGRLLYFIAVIEDISRRHEAEAELRRTQEDLKRHTSWLETAVAERTARLQEVVRELDTFSYSVAHDLRAPLRTVNGFAEILLLDHAAELSPTAKGHLDRIVRAGRRMDTLIKDVLEYSRLSRVELQIEDVDPVAVVREALDLLSSARDSGAQIEIAPAIPAVRCSRAALQQVLFNLLGNALKFTRPGVRPVVRVRGESAGDRVRIWVEDEGIGIPPEQQARIWDIFERLNPSYEGTGVGLSIVRRAVDRMQGRTGVESVPGQGSRFWIELPVAS